MRAVIVENQRRSAGAAWARAYVKHSSAYTGVAFDDDRSHLCGGALDLAALTRCQGVRFARRDGGKRLTGEYRRYFPSV